MTDLIRMTAVDIVHGPKRGLISPLDCHAALQVRVAGLRRLPPRPEPWAPPSAGGIDPMPPEVNWWTIAFPDTVRLEGKM